MAEDVLAIHGGPKAVQIPPPHYTWPIITSDTVAAVLRQLQTSISVYDRSGIIKRFEEQFSQYHHRRHALLNSSGTVSLLSAFHGLGIQPGDEVLCPVYTFFATVSPLVILGACPVFCDADENGNLDPLELDRRFTPRTKAVVVTHMWGIPCQMDSIVRFCEERNVSLIEDCSHAHGAKFANRLVGTFGKVAVWSLQGQKLVSGGEGGILLTDDDEIYYRAVLLGHYNKRVEQDVPMDHPLWQFSLTGFGLKFRAHPLAVAIAEEQFRHLDKWLFQKNEYAEVFRSKLSGIGWLRFPNTRQISPSWYALVLQYEASMANGLAIKELLRILQSEGLSELEQPRSTRPLADLPLFRSPQIAFPHLSKPAIVPNTHWPQAQSYFENALKLPVWTSQNDRPLIEAYCRGFLKVDRWLQQQRG